MEVQIYADCPEMAILRVTMYYVSNYKVDPFRKFLSVEAVIQAN